MGSHEFAIFAYMYKKIGSRYVQRSYENLEKFQQVKKKSIAKHKARFKPVTFCSTHKSPNHYTTAVVAAANHYFPPYIDKP